MNDAAIEAIAKSAYEQRIEGRSAPSWKNAGTLVQTIWVCSARALLKAVSTVLDEQLHPKPENSPDHCHCQRCEAIRQVKALFEQDPTCAKCGRTLEEAPLSRADAASQRFLHCPVHGEDFTEA